MPRRVKNPNRVVGFQPGNLCPHCGKQVKDTKFATGDAVGVVVFHVWNSKLCENVWPKELLNVQVVEDASG